MITSLFSSRRNQTNTVSPGVYSITLATFDSPLEYQIKTNARRKKVAIEIQNQRVVVKAPPVCTYEMVESFLTQQQGWIRSKVTSQALAFERLYEQGENIWYLGKPYRLQIHKASNTYWQLDEQAHQINIGISRRIANIKPHVRAQLRDFYLQQAKAYFAERQAELESKTGLYSKSFGFKFYQWRWGCCYQTGDILINPLLMAAPVEYIDCVYIHELCHLQHMDHSDAFWQLNQEYCSQCQDTKHWLKKHHSEVYLPPV